MLHAKELEQAPAVWVFGSRVPLLRNDLPYYFYANSPRISSNLLERRQISYYNLKEAFLSSLEFNPSI